MLQAYGVLTCNKALGCCSRTVPCPQAHHTPACTVVAAGQFRVPRPITHLHARLQGATPGVGLANGPKELTLGLGRIQKWKPGMFRKEPHQQGKGEGVGMFCVVLFLSWLGVMEPQSLRPF